MLLEALEPVGTLGGGICGGDAIYMLVKLPAGATSSFFEISFFPCAMVRYTTPPAYVSVKPLMAMVIQVSCFNAHGRN